VNQFFYYNFGFLLKFILVYRQFPESISMFHPHIGDGWLFHRAGSILCQLHQPPSICLVVVTFLLVPSFFLKFQFSYTKFWTEIRKWKIRIWAKLERDWCVHGHTTHKKESRNIETPAALKCGSFAFFLARFVSAR